jgi:transcriptional regulator with XRE-family HTH domain
MIKKEASEIGVFLRKLRFERNESQDEMAVKLGVTAPYISLLEGRQPVTKKIAIRLIKAYGLSEKDKNAFVGMVTRDIVRRFWGK